MKQAWQLKRSLSDRVTNTTVDQLLDAAMQRRARSAASCSAPAAAGSCCCSCGPKIRQQVRAALGNLITVPFKFEMSGGRIVLYQPNGL